MGRIADFVVAVPQLGTAIPVAIASAITLLIGEILKAAVASVKQVHRRFCGKHGNAKTRGAMTSLAKPQPKLLEKRKAKTDVARIDREENAKVKQRSQGWCEVLWVGPTLVGGTATWNCHRRASHVHHLISGIGRRNVGKSIEAAHKLHVCDRCHEEIHGHVLKPMNSTERESAATVRYERIR